MLNFKNTLITFIINVKIKILYKKLRYLSLKSLKSLNAIITKL
jgi:hypothetical protein